MWLCQSTPPHQIAEQAVDGQSTNLFVPGVPVLRQASTTVHIVQGLLPSGCGRLSRVMSSRLSGRVASSSSSRSQLRGVLFPLGDAAVQKVDIVRGPEEHLTDTRREPVVHQASDPTCATVQYSPWDPHRTYKWDTGATASTFV